MIELTVFVLGLVFGSFANVLIVRLPKNQSILSPGSRCPACGSPVRWYQNLPLISFIALRGRCAKCHSRISTRYPIVELCTGVLFLAAAHRAGLGLELYLRDWPILLLLVVATFIDLEHRIIPDEISIGGLLLAILTSFLSADLSWVASISGAAVGFGVFFAMAWVYEKFSGQMGLGGGDIKLLALIGAFLGVEAIFPVILISSLSGSLLGIAWGMTNRAKQLFKTAIPFGPFLVLGTLVYYFHREKLWTLLMINS